MPSRGPLSFLLFWAVALTVGTALVLLVLGDGFGWLVLTAAVAIVVLLVGISHGRHRQ